MSGLDFLFLFLFQGRNLRFRQNETLFSHFFLQGEQSLFHGFETVAQLVADPHLPQAGLLMARVTAAFSVRSSIRFL